MIKPLNRWPRAIVRQAAEKFGIEVADVTGENRKMRFTNARRYAARELAKEGYSRILIARVLGRDPVTVTEYLDEEFRVRRNERRKAQLRISRAAASMKQRSAAPAGPGTAFA